MKLQLLGLLIFISACTSETDTYETRLEIQNNLDQQIKCIIRPKAGYNLSCDTLQYISGGQGFVSIYAVGQSKSPEKILSSVIDSIRVIYTLGTDTSHYKLLFTPSKSVNYKVNPFTDAKAWTEDNTVVQHNSKVKLHLENRIFAIEKDSIIIPGGK